MRVEHIAVYKLVYNPEAREFGWSVDFKNTTQKYASILMLNVRWMSSGARFKRAAPLRTPALLTRTSTSPMSLRTRAAAACK